MKKFKEQNPLLFYGGIFIIAILIYGKIATNQKQQIQLESKHSFETKPLDETQTITESTEDNGVNKQNVDTTRIDNTERKKEFAKWASRSFYQSLRRNDLNGRSSLNKNYMYKDNKAFGRSVTIQYDDFFKKYHISFLNENGYKIHLVLLEENFEYEDNPENGYEYHWTFMYKKSIYRMVDNKLFF